MYIEGGYTPEQINVAVQSMVGTPPKAVDIKAPNKYSVTFEARETFQRFLMCNGRKVQGTEKRLA